MQQSGPQGATLAAEVGCAEDENPTGMVAWWYDSLEQKMYTLGAVRTPSFDVYAIERLLKQRVYVMN